jgi:hypothetical protein
MIALLPLLLAANSVRIEEPYIVTQIELNHVYTIERDHNGVPSYRETMQQWILWDNGLYSVDDPEDNGFHVVAWKFKNDEDLLSSVDTRTGKVVLLTKGRTIEASTFWETHTTFDREVADRSKLPLEMRPKKPRGWK